jgi:hypothetical protein
MSNLRETEGENQNNKEQILPTEEEVRRLREELAAKEAELLRLQKTKKEKVAAIFPREKKEAKEQIEKEKEEVLAVKEKPSKKVSLPKKPSPPKIKQKDLALDLQHVMSLPKPRQVKTLIYFAFKKGLHYATHVAEQLKNPYLLDEFHDTLVDELYEVLKKKKKI